MSKPSSPTRTPVPKSPVHPTTIASPSAKISTSALSPTKLVKHETSEDIGSELKQEVMNEEVKDELKVENEAVKVAVDSVKLPSSTSPTPSPNDDAEGSTDSPLTERTTGDVFDVKMTDDEAPSATKKRKRAEEDESAPQQGMIEHEDLPEDDVQQKPAAKKTKTAGDADYKRTPALIPRNGRAMELLKKSLKAELKARKPTKPSKPLKIKVSIGANLPECYDKYATRKLKEETTKIENDTVAKPAFKGKSWDDENNPQVKWKLIPKSTKYMKHKGNSINIENFLLNPYDHPDIDLKTYEEDKTFWLARIEDITWEEHQARSKVMWEAAKQERAQKAREQRTRERRERKIRAEMRDFEPEKNTHEASMLRKEMNGEIVKERSRVMKRKVKTTASKQAKKKSRSEEWIVDE